MSSLKPTSSVPPWTGLSLLVSSEAAGPEQAASMVPAARAAPTSAVLRVGRHDMTDLLSTVQAQPPTRHQACSPRPGEPTLRERAWSVPAPPPGDHMVRQRWSDASADTRPVTQVTGRNTSAGAVLSLAGPNQKENSRVHCHHHHRQLPADHHRQ